MASVIYRSIALILVGLALFYAGFTTARFKVGELEIIAAIDWQRGYEYGYKRCQYDAWKQYGIIVDEGEEDTAEIEGFLEIVKYTQKP